MAEALAREGRLDTELTWMLPYYYSIADYYLLCECPALRKASTENTQLWQEGVPGS